MVVMMMVVVAENAVVMMVVMPPPPTVMVMVMPHAVMVMMVAGKLNLRFVARLRRRPGRVGSVDGAQQRHRVRNGIEQLGERVRRRQCGTGVDRRGLGGVERSQSGNRADNAGNPLVHEHLLWWTDGSQRSMYDQGFCSGRSAARSSGAVI